jgi:hypothetical protein
MKGSVLRYTNFHPVIKISALTRNVHSVLLMVSKLAALPETIPTLVLVACRV